MERANVDDLESLKAQDLTKIFSIGVIPLTASSAYNLCKSKGQECSYSDWRKL
jgi:hypothetical protein